MFRLYVALLPVTIMSCFAQIYLQLLDFVESEVHIKMKILKDDVKNTRCKCITSVYTFLHLQNEFEVRWRNTTLIQPVDESVILPIKTLKSISWYRKIVIQT